MEKDIYIKLLDEGTIVYRPVPAIETGKNIYLIKGYELHDPEDENWEFLPGTEVAVIEKKINENIVLIAVKAQ